LLLLLSKSGNTAESAELAGHLASRGVETWLLSFTGVSALTSMLENRIILHLKDEGDLWNIVPNNSSVLFLMLLQALAFEIAKIMRLGLDDFRVNHPGGGIGEALKLARPNELNFISPLGLGDTKRLAGYKTALEQKYGAPIHFIIIPTHKIVMEMYGITNYSIHSFTDDELKNIGSTNPVPGIGSLYIAHPAYSDKRGLLNKWNNSPFHADELFKKFLDLENDPRPKEPLYYPSLTVAMLEAAGLAAQDLKKTALLLPEAKSVPALNERYWRNLAARLRREGYFVIQNYEQSHFEIKGVPFLLGDLETVAAFALSCGRVYSIRSGFCDLIAGKVENLTVLYPNKVSQTMYRMEKSFPGQELREVLGKEKKKSVLRYAKKLIKNIIKRGVKNAL
jgi:hypothetical protein